MFSSRTGSSHPSGRAHFCCCSSPLPWRAGGGKGAAPCPAGEAAQALASPGAAAAGIPDAPSQLRRGTAEVCPCLFSPLAAACCSCRGLQLSLPTRGEKTRCRGSCCGSQVAEGGRRASRILLRLCEHPLGNECFQLLPGWLPKRPLSQPKGPAGSAPPRPPHSHKETLPPKGHSAQIRVPEVPAQVSKAKLRKQLKGKGTCSHREGPGLNVPEAANKSPRDHSLHLVASHSRAPLSFLPLYSSRSPPSRSLAIGFASPFCSTLLPANLPCSLRWSLLPQPWQLLNSCSPLAAKTKELLHGSAAAQRLLPKLKVIREEEKLVCAPAEPWQGRQPRYPAARAPATQEKTVWAVERARGSSWRRNCAPRAQGRARGAASLLLRACTRS